MAPKDVEKEPLLSKNSGTFIAPVQNEAETDHRREKFWRWTSLGIAYIGQFVMFFQGSIYWVALWPYLSQVDPTVPESFQGYVIAAYNFGSMISAPLFGYWSNKSKKAKVPVLTGLLINMAGNLFFAFVEAFPNNRRWIFLLARFTSGFGSGSRAVLQAYVATASTLDERNTAMSFNAATISMAILIGPGMASLLTPIGYPGFVSGPFHFDMYTAAAYLSTIFGLIMIILFCTSFKEYYVGLIEHDEDISTNTDSTDDSNKDRKEQEVLRPFDWLAALNCNLVRFVMLFCVSYDDTIGSPFSMVMFNWNSEQAVLYNGLIQSGTGVLDVIGNLFVGSCVLRWISERIMILFGLVWCFMFYVFTFPWPGLPIPIETSTLANSSLNTSAIPSTVNNCHYIWCSYTPRINIVMFVFGYVCLSLAFSSAFSSTSTLYTKVLGPRRQGFMQGVFSSVGNLAFILGPIMVSNVFEFNGPRVAWAVAGSIVIVTFTIISVCYRRMITYYQRIAQLDSDKVNSISA